MMKQTKTHMQHMRMKTNIQKKEIFGASLSELYEKDVVCLKSTDSISDAATQMLEKHVGDIVIIEDRDDGKVVPIGMVTDRDIAIKSIAKMFDPESINLSDIMSKKIVTATENDDMSTLVKRLVDEGVSRLPIVDDTGALKGILSSKRLIQFFAQGLCELSSISLQQQKREEKRH